MIENDMGLTLKEQLEHEIERLRAEVEREQIAKAALQKLYDRAKQERDEARKIAQWLKRDWDGPAYDLLTAEEQEMVEAIDNWKTTKGE